MYELSKSTEWKYKWRYGASRRAVQLPTFTADAMESNSMKTIIVSCYKVGLGKMIEDTAQIIKDVVEDGNECLAAFVKTCDAFYLDFFKSILIHNICYLF